MNTPPVVTGMGAVCPLGESVPQALAGFRSAGPAATRVDFDFGARLSPNHRRRLDRLSQLVLAACLEAAEQATWGQIDGDRAALVIGTGLGCLEKTESYLRGIADEGLDYANAMNFPDSMDSSPAAHVAMALGCHGPTLTVTQREITGESALILADLLLRQGTVDVVMVAAGDAASPELERLLSRFAPGLRPGEAAAALVLETTESAARRGARIIGSLIGHGQAGFPLAGTALRCGAPEVLARARELALSMAGIPPGQAGEIPTVVAEEISSRIGWVLADGVLRAVLAMDRIAARAGGAAIVARQARGGSSAAVVLGPGR
jgi:3-oxoacyl-[acyl-carrier-protein] synthase II